MEAKNLSNMVEYFIKVKNREIRTISTDINGTPRNEPKPLEVTRNEPKPPTFIAKPPTFF